jgi:hypothetical protein
MTDPIEIAKAAALAEVEARVGEAVAPTECGVRLWRAEVVAARHRLQDALQNYYVLDQARELVGSF